jgi:hydroxymethylglutaryl-CoA reductase
VSSSTFPSFHKLSVKERARTVRDRGLLSSQDYKALVNGETVLDVSNADTMIENVIGVMGLGLRGTTRGGGAVDRGCAELCRQDRPRHGRV